ncbi:MAG: LytTR family DNA-binding domain-containing protein [Blautia sp.]|nr:LytTR family DNA-binding domain-containing protein [Lachnoclostridium sp.]MCM1211133.1 LytTR family DNA-binding domain-containing protein [Blautia sp.]
MRTILIVEDSARNMEMLIRIIEDLKKDVVIRTASTREEAGALAMRYTIDLFILDIILDDSGPSDASGMQFAEYIRTLSKYKYTPIIFVTALEDAQLYAYSALHCYFYVEKPYDVGQVSKVILEALDFPKNSGKSRSVFFRKDGVLYKKEISEIIYIENSRAGQNVYCTNGNLQLPYKPVKAILEDLDSDHFIQCSRYVIINRDYIDKIDSSNRYIQLKNLKESIEIGRMFKKRFLEEVLQ